MVLDGKNEAIVWVLGATGILLYVEILILCLRVLPALCVAQAHTELVLSCQLALGRDLDQIAQFDCFRVNYHLYCMFGIVCSVKGEKDVRELMGGGSLGAHLFARVF